MENQGESKLIGKRYIYMGDRLTDWQLKYQVCAAILREDGKCRRSRMGTMLVDFGNLGKHIVIASRLRKIKPWTGIVKSNTTMGNFKERLEAEKTELEGKLERLNAFNASEEANEIDQVQRSISIIQAGAMYTYLECLKEALRRL